MYSRHVYMAVLGVTLLRSILEQNKFRASMLRS